ncbi:MAG: nicotinate (nicotinamide) nucleotide adenylyltransferase [Bacteroidales bacterium]|nr:nicotinate (nicotinamide) nucleotide adenylyltransferase [Bacteroidales bacterium]MDD4603488.1 nicotinate (nicotinamide) nucleotide adenylyltransferase [Bacteroidales bacterium]
MKSNPKTGLLFGSFNPIHLGHLMIASYLSEFTDLEQIWFIVSPHNPLKEKKSLLADHHRLRMVNLAIEDDLKFKASNIEFKLPQPSYTIDTLTYLQEKYPLQQFIPIIGSDNLTSFKKWKNWETLLKIYQIYVYPRPDTGDHLFHDHPSFTMIDAPLITLSSTFIRQGIKAGRNMRHFLPEPVWKYIQEMNFYQK